MKRKRTWQLIEVEMLAVLDYWEESMGFPPEGVERDTLRPPFEEAFIRELGRWAWRLMGKPWQANKRAFATLNKLPPDGMEAMARYCSRHFLKHLPESGVTEPVFWDEYMLYMLRMAHQHVEQDETLTAYLKSRIGKPDWEHFLKRFVSILNSKESPEFTQRFWYCVVWDIYPMPLMFWADSAAADFLSGVSRGFNLDKVRNLRRELGLRRHAATIVHSFRRTPAPILGEIGLAHVEIDEQAAKRCGVAAMVPAFIEYLEGDGALAL